MKAIQKASPQLLTRACVVLALLAAFSQSAWAQTSSLAAVSSANNGAPIQTKAVDPSPRTAESDTRYRIGPGDVLDVRVARAPELSRDAVRVDQSGMIRMPMLDNDIQAACLTEGELAQSIARHYLKFKREPHVDVFVKEFQSQPVAVTGAVRSASSFKLQRQVRLLELLSFAGGPSENAGQTIQIVHAGGPSFCDKGNDATNDNASLVTYKLSETLRGVPEANPYVRPGDIVQVLDADQIYVVGNVLRPTAIPLKEPITISRAIAMAGGTAPSTKKDKIRIIRQLPGSTTKQEIFVDLGAIEKRKSEDMALAPNDIVDVPISGTRSLLRSLMGAVVPTISQLPVRVIP
jgi:polysaccharide export outer membrane protein